MTLAHDLYLFNEGRHRQAYRLLGAHPRAGGTLFRVWAPNAAGVSVIGEFNAWQADADPMRSLGDGGVWEAWVPGAAPGQLYRFAIVAGDGRRLEKNDPYARGFELRPGTAAYVVAPATYAWGDAD